MFKINYRITNSIEELNDLSEQEIDGGASVGGYFEIMVNNKRHGYFKGGVLAEGEEGFDLITTWFEGLFEVLFCLKKGKSYILLMDIDSYNTWIEFKKIEDGKINISLVKDENLPGKYQIETRRLKDIMCYDWANEIVSYDEMYKEIVKKATEYIDEIYKINKKLAEGRTFTVFKNLLLELKQDY